MKPIYKPSGAAKEYGDYAINIYDSCNHGCTYCYARMMTERFHGKGYFDKIPEPRNGIVEEVRKQLEKEKITDKLIHLSFLCDPYPANVDTSATREIIKLLKDSGNHVQILTKSDCVRDFNLLDENDWFGVSLTGATQEQEPNAASHWERLCALARAKYIGIKTWVSFEPVVNAEYVYACLHENHRLFDLVKIGKLNYHPSDIDWKDFGCRVESDCKALHINYYIKDSLRKEMEA